MVEVLLLKTIAFSFLLRFDASLTFSKMFDAIITYHGSILHNFRKIK